MDLPEHTGNMEKAKGITAAARLERLPFSPWHRKLAVLLGLGYLFDTFELFVGGFVIVPISQTFRIPIPATVDYVIVSLFLGAFFGGLTWSFLGDRIGRKPLFMYSLLLLSVGAFIVSLSSNIYEVAIFRFISGFGVGAEVPTISTYVSEFFPAKKRGTYFAYITTLGLLSAFSLAIAAYFLIPIHFIYPEGWRWLYLISSIGALTVWYYRLRLPESPRWLEVSGKSERADELVSSIEKEVMRLKGLSSLPEPEIVEVLPQKRIPFADLFRAPYTKRTVMAFILQFCQAGIFYGFGSLAPTILVHEGIKVTTSLQYSLLIYAAYPLGPLLSLLYIDRFERKWQVPVIAAILAVDGLAFAYTRNPVIIITTGFLFGLISQSWVGVFQTYATEIFPTRARIAGAVSSYSLSRLGSAFNLSILPTVLVLYGVLPTFIVIGLIALVLIIDVLALGPKTTRMKIEEVSK